MDILARMLPESKVHKNRSYDLVANSANPLAEMILTIRQGEPHRKNFTCEVYAVQSDPDCTIPDGMAFLLLKESNGEIYRTVISRIAAGEIPNPDNPPAGSCSCKAGQCRLWCKHREALTDAVYEVGLPGEKEAVENGYEYRETG
jgi:hypothetical protein